MAEREGLEYELNWNDLHSGIPRLAEISERLRITVD